MGEGRLASGDRIGDYRVDRVVDRGERLDVITGSHVVLPRRATIRIARTGDAGVRLLREACIVEALAHAGVPRVFDCGVLADRRPWVASEQVSGRSVAAALARGAMAPPDVAVLLRDVAAILSHAHRRGVVHRAIGPDAILMTDGARGWPVCLPDWSGARPLDAAPEPGRGGPHEAPELATGGAHDGPTDVFALGVVAYEMLSGTQLFDGAPPLTMVTDRVARYLGHRGPVSPATAQLAALVDSMLATDPLVRPASGEVQRHAAHVAGELERELADSAALAVAMLAVEEIALSDDTAETVVLDEHAADDEPIALSERPASSIARIRRPRWTPAFGRFSSEQTPQVAGEIDPDAWVPKD